MARNGRRRRGNGRRREEEKGSAAACWGSIGVSQPPAAPGAISHFPSTYFERTTHRRGSRSADARIPRHPSRGASGASRGSGEHFRERERERERDARIFLHRESARARHKSVSREGGGSRGSKSRGSAQRENHVAESCSRHCLALVCTRSSAVFRSFVASGLREWRTSVVRSRYCPRPQRLFGASSRATIGRLMDRDAKCRQSVSPFSYLYRCDLRRSSRCRRSHLGETKRAEENDDDTQCRATCLLRTLNPSPPSLSAAAKDLRNPAISGDSPSRLCSTRIARSSQRDNFRTGTFLAAIPARQFQAPAMSRVTRHL